MEKAIVGGSSVDLDDKIDGWTAGIDFNHDLDEKWSVQGRVGWFDWNSEGHAVIGGTRIGFNDSGNDWYAGASIGRKWRKRSSVGVGYTYFKANDAKIHLWGLHSEFRF